jgi:hypothetical protein
MKQRSQKEVREDEIKIIKEQRNRDKETHEIKSDE